MRGIIAQLRDLVPLRPLTWIEATQVAERQATRLLELSALTAPPVPEEIITRLPRVHVDRMIPSPAAGATQWSRGRWLVIIDGANPTGRQRFTIAHEFKHILDHPFVAFLYPPAAGVSTNERAESICDYFAGALLVPRPWLKKLWFGGNQDLAKLARTFSMSRQAMQVRLLQIGLTEPAPRCAPPVKRRAAKYERVIKAA